MSKSTPGVAPPVTLPATTFNTIEPPWTRVLLLLVITAVVLAARVFSVFVAWEEWEQSQYCPMMVPPVRVMVVAAVPSSSAAAPVKASVLPLMVMMVILVTAPPSAAYPGDH
jgi:NhaP-type Na+/H+ or K+/H+ antiporter